MISNNHVGATAWFKPWSQRLFSSPFCWLPWFVYSHSFQLTFFGLLDNSCFRGWGNQPHAQTQAGGSGRRIGDRVIKPLCRSLATISAASSDKCGLRLGYSCSRSQHGKIINDNIEFYPQNYGHFLIRLTCNHNILILVSLNAFLELARIRLANPWRFICFLKCP
jgi:hypothetical protein